MGMFDQAKDLYKLQKQAKQIKKDLKNLHIEAEVEGVTIVINGEQEVISVTIAEHLMGPENRMKVQELLIKAFNKAIKKSQEVAAKQMQDLMGGMGLDLPGLAGKQGERLMEKRLLQFFILFLGAWLIFSLWEPLWAYKLNESVDSNSQERIVFEIERGSSAKTIGKNLENADLIVSYKSFIRTLESEALDQSLRYGRFVLSPSLTLREVITILTSEGTGELAVTMIEGWTIQEMDDYLLDLGLIQKGEFIACTLDCGI